MRRENDKAAIKWIVSVIKGQWGWVAFATGLSSLSVICGVVMVLFMRTMINAAVAGEAKLMWEQFTIFALIIGFQFLLSYLHKRIIGEVQIKFTSRVKLRVMKSLFEKDYSEVRSYHSGELMNRITADVDAVAGAAMGMIPNVVSMIVRIIAAGVVLSILSWELIVLIAGFALVTALCMLLFRGPLKKLQRRVRETEGKTRGFMQETLINLPVVKAFAANEVFADKIMDYQNDSIRARIRHLRFSTLAHVGLGVAFTFVYVAALGWGCYSLIYVDGFDYGTLTAVLQLVTQVRNPLAGMTEVIPRFYTMLVSAERLMELEKLKDEQLGSSNVQEDAETVKSFSKIVIEGVKFGYEKNEIVLENIDLVVNRGDLVVLSGQSGIGKSTLMKLMLALYAPDAGSMTLQTEDGKSLPISAKTRPAFAYVPQGNLLFAGTVRDNITLFSKGSRDKDVCEALKAACMDEFVKSLPNGLDTVLHEDGSGLSEGQAQRIAVARAILYGAPVLLLDEATSALDEATEIKLLDNIKAIGKTCFIISHRSSVNAIATRKLIMSDARLSEIFD